MSSNVLRLHEVDTATVRDSAHQMRARSASDLLSRWQFVCSAVRRGAYILLPAPSPHERSESTKTEHRSRRRGAQRVSRLLDEGVALLTTFGR